jgi:G3E family GTPase
MSGRGERIPVVVLTGFLGSGKTTLLSGMLDDPEMGKAAVLVNELGEVALDHELLRHVGERTVVLPNGCLCCTLRDDLSQSLRELLDLSERGEIDTLERVVIETTGLAEPAPILNTMLADPVVSAHFRPEAVVTTVDAQSGSLSLRRHPESVKQAGAADRLVVTKSDLAGEAAVDELRSELRRINPGAPVLRAVLGDVALTDLLPPSGSPAGAPEEVERWLAAMEAAGGPDAEHEGAAGERHVHDAGEAHLHHGDVVARAMVFERPLDWTAFGVWLTMLLADRGEDVLRVKGLLDVGGPGPVVVNGVQHVVHPPQHLAAWPGDDHRSRVVFVTRGIDHEAVEASLAAFQRAAEKL